MNYSTKHLFAIREIRKFRFIISVLIILLCNSTFKLQAQWSTVGGSNGYVFAASLYTLTTDASGNVYAAGSIDYADNRYYVSKWDGTSWSELGGTNSFSFNGAIFSITIDATGNIYAAGACKNANNKNFVAKYNGSSWSELGGTNSSTFNSDINTITTDAAGNVYAAGFFWNTNLSRYVAKFNGTSWSELGGTNTSTFNGMITSLVTDASGNVYAGGAFKNANSNWYVAKFNGTSWNELGGANTSTFNNQIQTLAVDGTGKIFTGGYFKNTSNKNYVAKFDGSNWSEVGGTNSSTLNNIVFSIKTDAALNVYAGGHFTNANNKMYVTKFNGSNWSELGGTNTSTFNAQILSLAIDLIGQIYIAGGFGGPPLDFRYVAKFANTCTPTTSTTNATICPGGSYSFNGTSYNTAGSYIKHLTNVAGCDSAATLSLTVTSPIVPTISATSSTIICGGSVTLTSSAISGNQWYKNGVLISGATSNTYNATLAGNYTVRHSSIISCPATSLATSLTMATLPPITGLSSVCIGSQITLGNTQVGGIWSSTVGRATINTSGVVTGTSAGTATITYSFSTGGCSVTKNITLNALPNTPSIAYQAGWLPGGINPQATTVGGLLTLCKNRNFTAVGIPVGGIFSTTGGFITNAGAVITTGNIANTTGASNVIYTITDSNGCSKAKTINVNLVACIPKGVNSQVAVSNEQLVVYPNPARSLFTINCKLLTGSGSIIVTDLYGKTVKQQTLSMGTNTIDVSSFAKGIYMVSIITEAGKQTQKIVVE